jgi:Cft2 family RNA processing exonuclease
MKQKNFRLPLILAADFERACTIMGMEEKEAARQAIEDWLRKNKDQVSLESYMKQGTVKPVIFQNITLQKIQITIVKSELQRLLRVLGSCQPESKMDFLKEIQRILPSAFSLFEETRDPELQDLIRQVESLARAEAHLERSNLP